jgi:hypothetical protein
VDVPASLASPDEAGREVVKHLAQSLDHGPFPEWKGGPYSYVLEGLGTVQLVLPAEWRAGHRLLTQAESMPGQHTLTFFSATDPNKVWKMTFFKSATRYKTLESLRHTAGAARKSVGEEQGGGQEALHEIKLRHGVGCQSVSADAALADRPVQPGSPKVMCSAFLAPQPDILVTVAISADEAGDPDLLSAIEALSTLEWQAKAGK